jgi:hypothetical protein
VTDLPIPKPVADSALVCSVCGYLWNQHPKDPTAEDCIALMSPRHRDRKSVRALIIAEAELRKRLARED